MCGRYVLAQKIDVLEKHFNAHFVDNGVAYKPSYNIAPGQMAAVVTYNERFEIRMFRFGLTPFWSKKPMLLFNARAEGDENMKNNPEVHSRKGIINKPAFRKPIRSQRCLVIADCFFEGPEKEKLSKPYLVYLKHRRPFSFAGIWDTWLNPQTNEKEIGFAIITTTANKLMRQIQHPRCPVILKPEHELTWLKTDHLATATSLLKPYPSEEMNAYPISNAIKNASNNDVSFLQPIGERLQPEEEIKVRRNYELQGMGNRKRREPGITLEERAKLFFNNDSENQNIIQT